ncbi:hypothetical protein [Streptomyces sp. NPDC002788]
MQVPDELDDHVLNVADSEQVVVGLLQPLQQHSQVVAFHLLWSEDGLQRKLSQLPGEEEGRLWDPGVDQRDGASVELAESFLGRVRAVGAGQAQRVGPLVFRVHVTERALIGHDGHSVPLARPEETGFMELGALVLAAGGMVEALEYRVQFGGYLASFACCLTSCIRLKTCRPASGRTEGFSSARFTSVCLSVPH